MSFEKTSDLSDRGAGRTVPTLEAVLFDFNGTLFRDAAFHDRAWALMGERHGRTLHPGDLERHIIGFTNREILDFLFQSSLTDAEVSLLSDEKETIYRDLCRGAPDVCNLAPGAEAFLDFLKARGIPRTVVTAAIASNVRFFFETFGLDRWFRFEDTVLDDERIQGKPFPDMYLEAARRIGVPMDRCMVIEDSRGGLTAAIRAGAGHVTAVSSDLENAAFIGLSGIDAVVRDFSEIDRTLFRSAPA